MENLNYLLRKAGKLTLITTVMILVLWSALVYLAGIGAVLGYLLIGVFVCWINALIFSLKTGKLIFFQVKSSWLIMAGVVLVLYHAGFQIAAVFASAAIFASPLFWASICEGVVGLSLLLALAYIV